MKTEQNPFLPFLKDGETLLWYGRPNAAYWRKAERCGQWQLLGWVCAALGVYAAADAWAQGTVNLYWGIPVYILAAWAVGLWLTSMRRDLPMAVHYAVTNQRILEVPGTDGDAIKELSLSQIKSIRLRSKRQYVSTVVFIPTFLAPDSGFQFLWIEGAYKVYEKVTALVAQIAAG